MRWLRRLVAGLKVGVPGLTGLSLRVRLLLIGVAGVAGALALGSVVLYGILTVAVNRTLDNNQRATAEAVRTLVQQGSVADPLPVSGALIVQVVDGQNRVLAASPNADRLTALLRPDELARALAGEQVAIPGSRAAVSGPLRAVAADVGNGQRVVVAAPVGDVEHGQDVLRTTLLSTYPLLLAVLAVIAWWVIGRTLRPVEALRAGAERISGTGEDERLPEPRSGDEIHALSVTLNGMLDRLAASRARQRAFVADAAHELRSPLASMRTQLEVAERLGEGGDLPSDLLTDVSRLSALVEDLLLLARSGADSRPASSSESFDTRTLLAEVAGRYAAARVPVSVADGSPVFASADREEVRRALANVVDNAVRYATTAVTLSASTDAASALLTADDDGPGIPAGERERVFERFARLDDARDRDAGGTGLGLAIVRELMRRSGGSVSLTDRPAGPGLRVELRLPR